MPAADRIVLCMKWGHVFGPDYVNVLYNATRANLTGDFRFICLTDDSTGFLPGILALPIPDIGLTQAQWYTQGVWPKLALYVADLHGLSGRCLFIDLDMMIIGPLDDMFQYGSGVVTFDVGENMRAHIKTARPEPGTGVFAFDIGQETQILKAFQDDPAAAMRRFQNEQDFVGAHASQIGFWPRDWVISFKRRLRQPIGLDLFLPPCDPPPGTRILAFHGTPRPIDLIPERPGFWDRFPHLGHGQVRFVADYWRNHGGHIPKTKKDAIG